MDGLQAGAWLSQVRSSPENSGLVLGGGGAKGCYEIGVWKALDELGIHFGCAAGTSIGALVGAMYVQGSLQAMETFVEQLKPEAIAQDLFALPDTLGQMVHDRKEIGSFLEKYILSRKGMNISPLKDALSTMFHYSVFEKSKVDYACMTFNLTKKQPEAYFKNQMNAGNAQDIILASASCYPAFPVMEMNGQEYIDGGYWDNVPVDLALKMGAKRILAINVEGPGITRPIPKKANVLLIKPIARLGNFLDFTAESASAAMRAGYLEMCLLAGKYCGLFYSFEKKQEGLREFVMGSIDFLFSLYRIRIAPGDLKGMLLKAAGCSDSDLFDALEQPGMNGQLIEALALCAGIDSLRVWDYLEFLFDLKQVLSRLDRKYDSWKEYTGDFFSGKADRMTAVCLIRHYAREKEDKTSQSVLSGAAKMYPLELALALTWIFLEELYG